jgi:rhamnulose-1-phosphate aldolase/alcohol dehydrogenase
MVTNRWNDSEAAAFTSPIDARVYTSRLLGGDPELVMHGGGNTSVKDVRKNLFEESERVIYIKGSGWDLATIEAPGFPAVRMEPLEKLRHLERLSDPDMVNYLRTNLCWSPAPDPSVETLLHAFLPFAFVDHTHADAVLTLTNQPDGEKILSQLYEGKVGIVPYIMPGFQLAKECMAVFEKNPNVEGLILLKHGVITFADTAKASYDRMIQIVQKAQAYIENKKAKSAASPSSRTDTLSAPITQAIRQEFQRRNFPAVLLVDDSVEAKRFTSRADLKTVAQRGPITPDHVIRTKRLPLIIDTVNPTEVGAFFDRFAQQYQTYFESEKARTKDKKIMLDTLPRVILLPGIGVLTAGKTLKDARIALDIYQHTMTIIENAEGVGSYEALPAGDIFDVEYWVLEQAKLSLAPKALPLTGKVAVVTGGASGIGKAIARQFLEQGAIVHILDINAARFTDVSEELKKVVKSGNGVFFHAVDLCARTAVAETLEGIIRSGGGVDIVIANAGIFPPSSALDSISLADWGKSVDVNLNASFHLVSESLRWMKTQPMGGDIVFIASKNVPAPGPEAGAYSVPKAAQVQLARVCALEAGKFGIRVNVLHPHLIFDTGIWGADVIEKRAKAYGLTAEQYRKNNLLKTELTSADVARATFALVSGYFSKTTGAQIPVDGGSDRTL